MKLLAPSSSKDLIKTAQWFKNPIARRLFEEKGVEFGFELKGQPATIAVAPDLFWGYHIPTNFAEEYYYHLEKRQELLDSLKHIVKLKPNYVNVHGTKLWWKPAPNEYVQRYEMRSSTEEYFHVLESTVDLVKKLMVLFPQLTFENTTLLDYYHQDCEIIPMTLFQTSIGTALDQIYICQKTGAEPLFDIEHSMIGLNFLNREKNYADLKLEKFDSNFEEKKLVDIFGYKIKKGFIPYAEPKLKFANIMEKLKAKKYHVTGSTQDVISGKKDLNHGPIKVGDLTFRKNLRLILAQKPELILVETANKADAPCFSYLRQNETELSFYHLCQILLEEL